MDSKRSDPRVLIVGAGVSGLSFAHFLRQKLPKVNLVVLEKSEQPGGKIFTQKQGGFIVEGGPNGFLDNKPFVLNLAREIGLQGQLIPASSDSARNRFIALKKRLHSLPVGPLSFLRSDVLSGIGKLRLVAELLVPPKPPIQDESIDHFARRRLGDEAAKTLVDAFVTGIFAGDPKRLSLRAALPRLAMWEREHGGILRGFLASRKTSQQRNGSVDNKKKGSVLWSFRGGLSTLTDALGRNLGRSLFTQSTLKKIIPTMCGWKALGDFPEQDYFDAVVVTCPPPETACLLEPIDRELSARFQSLPMNQIAVVCLGYNRGDVPHPLNGFGYLCPRGERQTVLGVQWCSSIFSGRAPEGKVLLRAMCGGGKLGDVVSLSDEELKDQVRMELARMMGIRAAPIFAQVIKWPTAIPQYPVGHLETIRWIQDRLHRHPGLFIAGNAFQGVAMNDCVDHSRLQAEAMANYLREHSH